MSSRQQVQTACQNCRQRRAKCNGEQPCNRCEQRGQTCEYRGRQWVSKSDLRAEIGRLRHGLGKLSAPPPPPPPDPEPGTTRDSAGVDDPMQSWIDGVKSPDDTPSAGPFPPRKSPRQPFRSSDSSSCFDQLLSWRSCHPTFLQRNPASPTLRGRLTLPSAPLDAYGTSTDLDMWTQIGWTRAHIRHLFDVLITWDNVSFCILRKKEFLQDYETGSSRFCSRALVHAALAVATRLLNETKEDAHVLPSGWLGSKYFLRKADTLLREQGSSDSLPDIQSLDADYLKVRATTYCGAISLLRMLNLTTGALFNEAEQSLEDSFILDQLPDTGAGADAASPVAANDVALSLQIANPQVLVVKMFQLTEWVYKVVVAHQRASHSNESIQEDILETYTKCLGWYRDVFELIGNGGSRSPFILFVHMYYHFCLLCAFRPFVGYNFTDTDIQPHDMCIQAVQSILALAQSYDDLFTLRRVSALIPYFVCASGLFSLAIEDSRSDTDFSHIPPRDAGDSQASCPTAPGSSPLPTSRIRVSSVVQARILLSKMGESHPAATMATEKLKESLTSWHQSRGSSNT
ncbi:Fungal transcriptional regulatory protein [Cordyceps militaris CM01]|uniref:Fungal transcriptional regulatory protein n=1 Tax=Cordyceps militaris (strain CM01) TaxID=983644 RepID=G3JKB4_CORMM|nr:Fungal transcriptional regulatory protein [Cordyceps militaris CM01]EGX91398.1 Fungal transcriptional regulatory protein [Cordyceps militaris CM01]